MKSKGVAGFVGRLTHEESATSNDGLPATPICRFGTLEGKRGAR